MFSKVLIANRGAIACRIIRTLKRMGVGSVAVFSDADAGSLHVAQADEAVRIGPAPAVQSYLYVDAILAAAKASGAQAIHPGYGFLSENTAFAEACEAAGIAFIGPTPENVRAFGLKHTARALALAHDVPLAPGTDLLTDADAALAAAERIGFPVILKATAGGGGIGMRVCEDAAHHRPVRGGQELPRRGGGQQRRRGRGRLEAAGPDPHSGQGRRQGQGRREEAARRCGQGGAGQVEAAAGPRRDGRGRLQAGAGALADPQGG